MSQEQHRSPVHELASSLMSLVASGIHLLADALRFAADGAETQLPQDEADEILERSRSDLDEAADRVARAVWDARSEIDHASQPPLDRPSTEIRGGLFRLRDRALELCELSPVTVEDTEALYEDVVECEDLFADVSSLLPPTQFLIESARDYFWELWAEFGHQVNRLAPDPEGSPDTPSKKNLKSARPCVRKALASYERAMTMWPDLLEGGRVTEELFDRIRQLGTEDEFPEYFAGDEWVGPPSWHTFRRYVNDGLQVSQGKTGTALRPPTRSIVRIDEA